MYARYLNLRHVTRDTVLRAHRTARAGKISLPFFRHQSLVAGRSLFFIYRRVACETFLVVRRSILHQWLVRVVARYACKPGVASPPALALFQSIRLEPRVDHSSGPRKHHVALRAMTRAAEIHRRHRIQPARIENGNAARFDFPGLHRRNVARSRPVAPLASNSWRQVRSVKVVVGRGTGRVAPKAAPRLIAVQPSTHRGLEVVRRHARMSGREIQTLQRPVETQPAFVKLPVALVDVSLALVPQPKSPCHRTGERIPSVRHRKVDHRAARRKLVTIRTHLRGQLTVRLKNFRLGRWSRRVRHRRRNLLGRYLFVTFSTLGSAHEVRANRTTLGRPKVR